MRHSVVCRLGVGDTAKVVTRPGDQVTDLDFVAARKRLDHGVGDALDYLAAKGFKPSERAVDLLVLAAVVTAADTRIRRLVHAQDNWTREMDLYVPVHDPTLWNGLGELIAKTLGFLTGDRWRFFFRPRPVAHKTVVPEPKQLRVEEPSCVCLLSGGLDSFIGAIDLLSNNEKPLFVSHWWDSKTSWHQSYCLERLNSRFPGIATMHLRTKIGFSAHAVEEEGRENTLRARSFLFFALAALAADSLNRKCMIYVPENGLISLNVPLDPLRLGALSTRTTHPYYMARWNELLTKLFIEATLTNPYRFQTKGAMVAGCKDKAFLKRTAKYTMSCSHPDAGRFLKESPGHCGRCMPCLIRRAALVAGFGADDTPYKTADLTATALDSEKAEGSDVRSFQFAIARLKKRPALAQRLIYQPGPLSDYPQADIKRYADVYRDGIAEVARLLKGVECRPL